MLHAVHDAVVSALVLREVQSADPAAAELAHHPVRASGGEYALALRGVALSAPRVHGICNLGVAGTSFRVVVRLHRSSSLTTPTENNTFVERRVFFFVCKIQKSEIVFACFRALARPKWTSRGVSRRNRTEWISRSARRAVSVLWARAPS